ncbi:FAD/NAD(P)-binding protein [Sphingobium chlorophenolicum]|uniref:FAD dependent oxidoreductase n=1 Tax=Sphingobium chlorophenolicum TaxID=46429 RepID=A0A081R9T8_SPHCR|nr:FAD/NAD(P)-binding protein [Sphingobium chlorophenolicum]KEQ51961.1 FAD dependent oxidoreductase [Sphingobium chlorophenolicum]
MLRVDHAAIVGGGFSGTLLAINLLRHGTPRVTMVERRGDRLGRGLAYGAARDGHVLNVRAANMSALPDSPDHFTDWLKRQGLGQEGSFATRRDYGAYLCAMLDEARGEDGGRLTIVTDEAVDLRLEEGAVHVALRSGGGVDADIAVLAPGNLPPHDLPAFAGLAGDGSAYVDDPWAATVADGLAETDQVLLLGSGLTAVDCALSLEGAGFRGRIVAVSRRGLAPRSHAPTAPYAEGGDRPTGSASALVRALRHRAAEIGWRSAVDEQRRFTQDMWRAASAEERSRFLRHLRSYWDVHRHRIAPQVADRLAAMQAEGRLEIRAAKVVEAVPEGRLLRVHLRRRGQDGVEALPFARVVNCTGPLGDLRRTDDPLLRQLAVRGDIRPDPLAIGIDVDRQCHAIARDGSAQQRLFVVGPMTRGAHWEIVAVPDIRRQVWEVAREMTGAHWVEAEGL